MSRKSIARTSRLQLVLEKRSLERLKRVQKEVGAPSMSATLITALDLYCLIISVQQAGDQIFLIKETEEGRTEKEILFF
ncbi:MAG: hypothetical protein JWL88_107 [Parcubacteria group bacterium]|nr:hypothetical protein [Parcubacteria group bacterium]